MRKSGFIFLIVISSLNYLRSQVNPVFGQEKVVSINGYTLDAMEPFISPDGNTLFFNSLNAGGNTNLHYASRIDDTTFNYVGLVDGTYDSSSNHLDAVASLSQTNDFFWISMRGYPSQMETVHHGAYAGGVVSSSTRVYGDFNIYSINLPYGWLIMDAAIDVSGNYLFYCNARFDLQGNTCGGLPCDASLGVAQKVNDSTFNKLPNTAGLFMNINDTSYLVYAPQLSADGMELYYTRLLKGTFNTEICVAVRALVADTFGAPSVIWSNNGYSPEAATITNNMQQIYYHQKDGTNKYRMFLRYRSSPTALRKPLSIELCVYPNPANDKLFVKGVENGLFKIWSVDAKLLLSGTGESIDVSGLQKGLYILQIETNTGIMQTKIIKN